MDNQGEIIIYQTDNGLSKIEVKMLDETVWLTQQQLVELYQTSKANISEHIKNIYNESELDEVWTVRKFRTVQNEGNRQVSREITYYNLDMIISLGYRIKSLIATKFRKKQLVTCRKWLFRKFEGSGKKGQKEIKNKN